MERHPSGNRNLAVVYLARLADGIDAVRRFVRSYQTHDAGVPHDLVVILKGYRRPAQLQQARSVFDGVPHLAIEMEDSGFDIGAYFNAARALRHSLVCFVNTFTEIAADGWLLALHRHASLPQVGIAAAMGSYESLASSMMLTQAVLRHCTAKSVACDAQVAYYYDFMINGGGHRTRESDCIRLQSTFTRMPRRLYLGYRSVRQTLCSWMRTSRNSAMLSRFPRFPNPHIRSNGFMMLRERFLSTNVPVPKSKWDAYAFESGARGLTAQLRSKGLATIVVDRDGRGYDVNDWCHSNTFRMGDQHNLILTDNQTRTFTAMSPGHRATMTRMTWGDYYCPAPEGFPKFGFEFARAR